MHDYQIGGNQIQGDQVLYKKGWEALKTAIFQNNTNEINKNKNTENNFKLKSIRAHIYVCMSACEY